MRYAIAISRLILNRPYGTVSSTSGIAVLEGIFHYMCSPLACKYYTCYEVFVLVGVLKQGPPCWHGRRPST